MPSVIPAVSRTSPLMTLATRCGHGTIVGLATMPMMNLVSRAFPVSNQAAESLPRQVAPRADQPPSEAMV